MNCQRDGVGTASDPGLLPACHRPVPCSCATTRAADHGPAVKSVNKPQCWMDRPCSPRQWRRWSRRDNRSFWSPGPCARAGTRNTTRGAPAPLDDDLLWADFQSKTWRALTTPCPPSLLPTVGLRCRDCLPCCRRGSRIVSPQLRRPTVPQAFVRLRQLDRTI